MGKKKKKKKKKYIPAPSDSSDEQDGLFGFKNDEDINSKDMVNNRSIIGVDDHNRFGSTLMRYFSILGLIFCVVGCVILLRSYFIFTWDKFGWGLIIIGGVSIIAPQLVMRSMLDPNSEEQMFEFKLFNKRFDDDVKELDLLLDKSETSIASFSDLPKSTRKLLNEKKKKDTAANEKTKEKVIKKLTQKVQKQLKEGFTAKEILENLTNPRVYVFDFEGDIMATQVKTLRDFVSFVINIATFRDEVVIRLSSPGGTVPHYGLGSAQLVRLRTAGIPTTVCVDTMAASGGYMMACVAQKIVASPFAFIGSIGVMTGVPNFHRLLKKQDIDYHSFTAGRYKQTVTMLSEVKEEHKNKLQQDILEIHKCFKEHVKTYRQDKVNIDAIATGEYWVASVALKKGLVDCIKTSDEYLSEKCYDCDVIEISQKKESTYFKTIKDMLWDITGRIHAFAYHMRILVYN